MFFWLMWIIFSQGAGEELRGDSYVLKMRSALVLSDIGSSGTVSTDTRVALRGPDAFTG